MFLFFFALSKKHSWKTTLDFIYIFLSGGGNKNWVVIWNTSILENYYEFELIEITLWVTVCFFLGFE